MLLRQTQVHLPNSGYNPGHSGLFFLPFPNRIWACSLKGEVVRFDWPGPSARSQQTAPTVVLPSVSVAQPPYPNGEAVSPGCVSVSAGHTCYTGWQGAGPRFSGPSMLSACDPFSKSEVELRRCSWAVGWHWDRAEAWSGATSCLRKRSEVGGWVGDQSILDRPSGGASLGAWGGIEWKLF